VDSESYDVQPTMTPGFTNTNLAQKIPNKKVANFVKEEQKEEVPQPQKEEVPQQQQPLKEFTPQKEKVKPFVICKEKG